MIAEYELERESDERLFVSYAKDGVCPPHFHRKLELVYVLKGTKQILCDSEVHILTENQIFIADSYAMHSYEPCEGGQQIIIVLPNHMLKDYYLLFNNKKLKSCVILDKEVCIQLKPLFMMIVNRDANPLIYQGSVDLLLGKIIEIVGQEDRNVQVEQSFLEEVLAYISENYKEEITLDSLAEHFGYSKYYFSRMFNSCFNTNLSNYLAIIRLQAVIHRLRKGDCTVSDAAFECGFSSIQTFYRALKKNYNYKNTKDLLYSNNEQTDYNKYDR